MFFSLEINADAPIEKENNHKPPFFVFSTG
jgi:hypothetical protein